MKAFLFSTKDERVNRVYSKFHIIPMVFEFLVQLAIYNGKENKRVFERIIGMGTHVLSLVSFFIYHCTNQY